MVSRPVPASEIFILGRLYLIRGPVCVLAEIHGLAAHGPANSFPWLKCHSPAW